MAAQLIKTKVKILSYNMHGLNQGRSLLSDLCSNKDAQVIFVHEHWQTPATMCKIINFSSKCVGYGKSAMDTVVSTGILSGRPFGGVTTFVHNNYASRIVCLKCDERFVIITLDTIVLVTVHFP